MSLGEVLTRWTIRAALLLYVAVLAGHLWYGPWRALPPQNPWPRVSRWLWTLGCAALWLHLAAAFHYYHHWSHADAAAETVRQTKTRVGVDFTGGIYFNYAMALLWLGDCLGWWVAADRYWRRPWPVTALVHGYLLFMAINGAVVFEAGPTRWLGLLAVLVLTGLMVRQIGQRRRTGDVV